MNRTLARAWALCLWLGACGSPAADRGEGDEGPGSAPEVQRPQDPDAGEPAHDASSDRDSEANAPDAEVETDAGTDAGIDAGADAGDVTYTCGDGDHDHDGDPTTPCAAFTDCPAGQHVDQEGSADSDRSCAACPSETYSTEVNALACAAWATCAAGTFVAAAGSATADRVCETCAAGTFTAGANEAACAAHVACAAGTIQVAAGTPAMSPECEGCAGGSYCAGGTAAAVACADETWDHDADPATPCASRTQCPAGQHVASSGSATADRGCAPCATDSFSATSNEPSCTSWTQCSVGQYVVSPGSATTDRQCAPCADGT